MIHRLAIAATVLLLAASPPPTSREINSDGVTDLTLQGVRLRVLVTPAVTGMPVFSAAAAERAALKAGMFGAQFGVGPVKLRAKTAVASLAIGTVEFKRRVAWASEPFAAGFDGVIGPGGLPEDVVRFTLRPPQPGEHMTVLPFRASHWGVSGAAMAIGGVETFIRFDPHAPRTVANATAGVALANAHRGTLSGEPFLVPIAFGIQRPVRTLTLADPVAVGPLTFAKVAVRISDGGPANTIREADADPDEVQVVAKGKPRRASLLVGADLLVHCSSIVFDKPAKVIRLTCA